LPHIGHPTAVSSCQATETVTAFFDKFFFFAVTFRGASGLNEFQWFLLTAYSIPSAYPSSDAGHKKPRGTEHG
jgi:hypothetical protein